MTNSFGEHFKITTFGESHGKGIGVVIDGCPSELEIDEAEIYESLEKRKPGFSPYVSQRKEPDMPQILSGTYLGKTTGAPICIWIKNQDARPKEYSSIEQVIRPGHANVAYFEKYGHFDPRGGGRASARETAARVAAGAVAKKLCDKAGIQVCAFLQQIGSIEVKEPLSFEKCMKNKDQSSIFCPNKEQEGSMIALLEHMIEQKDSIGGVVQAIAQGVPTGLGDPQYMKIEAQLASSMLSIPASKGFEIGRGFKAAGMKGSEHNDEILSTSPYTTKNNVAGGTLGGITTGENIEIRVAFKPTSSIKQKQQTFDLKGNPTSLQFDEKARHDPCLAIRAVPVVEAMFYLTLADRLLANERTKNQTFATL